MPSPRAPRPRAQYPAAPVRLPQTHVPTASRRNDALRPRRTVPMPPSDVAVAPLLYSKRNLAIALDCSESHIDNLVKEGRLKATLIGKRKKHFSVDAVQEFIAAGTQPKEIGA